MEEGELFQNKYRIGKLLGEGGMGVVYAAVQEPSGLKVAIKFVSAKNVRARNLQGERLIREAKVLARLNHGNLVRLYDFDKTADGDYFIVMELVEGDTLRTLITRARKQGKGLDPQQVLHIMAQVAEGMVLAHKAGVVHRDLKPENIMVLEGGDPIVRVVDFGLAKNPTGSAAPLLAGAETNPANVVGTPRYMAPEQVRGYEIDARTDVYAIGVTMYEALTGHAPYEREDDHLEETEIMARHCFAEPTPIYEHVPNCPERVSKIVLRCLAKDPAERYQTARELARDMRRVLAEEAKAQHRDHKSSVKEVRETEPMPVAWTPRAVLPFVSSERGPALAPRMVRETAPMPPPGPSGPPQPTYAGAQSTVATAQYPVGRGVGYTTKMPRPSAAALAVVEEHVAHERVASPVPLADSVSPSGPPRSGSGARDSDGHAISDHHARTSAASTSGTRLKQQGSTDVQAGSTGSEAALERINDPLTMSPRQSLSGASVPQRGRTSRAWILGVPPMFAAPILGSAIAALVLFVVVLRRTPAQHPANGTSTATASVPPPPPPETAAVSEAPARTAAPAVPPNSSPSAEPPTEAQKPMSVSVASTATARISPSAMPRASTSNARPPERSAAPKPLQSSPQAEREPAVPSAPAPAPTPATGRLFGVDR
ncbi:Serine/threonine protein kinase [Minicystis rosea]|nr:Serine/threonine protein kinase [Minicystis rosea]